jgi:outer membrane protein OmpA-like peptidoglycan-associated protein
LAADESDRAGGGVTASAEGPLGAGGAAGTGVAGEEGTSVGAGGTGVDDIDQRIASIDVPSGNVNVDEDLRPQTLGGMLPLILGVNEEGTFAFDQYSLRVEVKAALDALASELKTADYDRLDVFGYTDRIGTVEYNKRLSELRAYAVAQYLIQRGVPDNKIRYEGRGEKDPLTQSGECTGLAREELISCLQKDRRVEIEASIRRKHATVVQ